MRISFFFIFFVVVMALLNYYIYKRFFKKLDYPFNRYACVVPSLLMLGEFVFVIEAISRVFIESPALYWLFSTTIGITFVLFVITLVYDLNLSLFKRIPYQHKRRKFIKIMFDTTMLILAVSYLFRGFKGGLSMPVLNTVDVAIEGFSKEGYVIMQLSDLHVGRTIKKSFVETLVTRTNAQHPNIIVITGDLVDHSLDAIKKDLSPLQKLNAPTYFILGNHEYFHGATEIIAHIRSLGITVLLNESLRIEEGDLRFNLVGLTDVLGERIAEYPMDIEKAYKETDPALPCIILAHQPKTILRLEKRACDLMLSGHTHGGQIFPFGLLVMLDQPYLSGLHRHDTQKQIFVSRGTGYWGPPLRVLAPSEISKIVIRGTV